MSEYVQTGSYTDSMESRIYAFDPDAEPEEYRKFLMDTAGSFRTMAQVLEQMMIRKGFEGNRDDPDEKRAYAEKLFRNANVPVPRNLRGYFDGTIRFDRDKKTPFQFCFAFGLTLQEAEAFFRRCCLGRGFDLHSVRDAVFAFAIRKGLDYREACQILEQLPKKKQTESPSGREPVYTESLAESLSVIETKEELLLFLQRNEENFYFNNVTGAGKIRELWMEITNYSDGYLNQELERLSDGFDDGKARKKWSEDGALRQILGLQGRGISGQLENKRSLKEILRDNRLLHPLAADCFPNRNALRNILEGKHVSYESVRKMLILLLFYRFWIRKALGIRENGQKAKQDSTGIVWKAMGGDGERCRSTIDRHLMEAGFPGLYYGNPYDWLFLFAMINEEPLPSLRYFMMELYLEVKDTDGE